MPSEYRLITVDPYLSHPVCTVGNTVGSLSGVQRSIVIGTLLGDGTMRCRANALLEINHSIKQRSYVDWKYRNLADLVGTPPKERPGNGGRVAYRFVTRSLSQLTPFFRLFYQGGRKQIPFVELSPLTMAVWLMDDGCKSRRAVYLNTQQFDGVSQLRMIEMLRQQWSIEATLNRDKEFFRIRLRVESTRRFTKIVEPFVLPEFRYKLPQVTP
jgi:hypothetical protein